MSRFLITLAAVVVAGAMYVAAAPGSQTAAAPTAKQFKALKGQVSKLQKEVKTLTSHTNTLASVIFDCMLHQTVGVAQRGDPGGTYGYAYTPSGSTPVLTTALDLSGSPTYTLLTLNPDPQLGCSSLVGLSKRMSARALSHLAHHR